VKYYACLLTQPLNKIVFQHIKMYIRRQQILCKTILSVIVPLFLYLFIASFNLMFNYAYTV